MQPEATPPRPVVDGDVARAASQEHQDASASFRAHALDPHSVDSGDREAKRQRKTGLGDLRVGALGFGAVQVHGRRCHRLTASVVGLFEGETRHDPTRSTAEDEPGGAFEACGGVALEGVGLRGVL